MKAKALLASMLLCAVMAQAQDDPTIMTINGQKVSRSEFEYSYNKNNTDGVIDKKSVDEYVDLFVNYKLKVQAALDAKMDTLPSFKKEFRGYRDQQIRPSFVTDDDVEAEAKLVYENTKKQIGDKGLFTASHILLRLGQKAPQSEQDAAKQRIDSIYNALLGGADFADMARKVSQDPGTASKGGKLPQLGPGQLVKEFEDVAYSLQPGEMSKPFLSPFGYHIVKMIERSQLPSYDSLRTDIMRFIEARGVREHIANKKLKEMAEQSQGKLTEEQIMDQRAEEMQAKDPDLKYLVKEYYDGLLLFEISNANVWDKAAKDLKGQEKYFKKNKKKYKWDTPRFKGIAYHTREAKDVEAVKKSLKGVSFDKWAETLRKTFNNDSILRIRVEKGLFKQGDNKLVDKQVFKQNVEVKPTPDYPNDATYGEVLKAPKSYEDVKEAVLADYQDELEKEWVAQLRKKYKVEIDRSVLSTVNKHN